MSKIEWAAFSSLTGHGYGIGPIPGAKRAALYHKSPPNCIRPIAYFQHEEDASAFLAWLERHVTAISSEGA